MKITFFGAYDPAYPRSAVIRKGLRLNGADVAECRAGAHLKSWVRYPLLMARWKRSPDFVFVPEFCQKDVPLAAFLARLAGKKVIFDPLAARFETKVVDWGWKPTDSPASWWNFQIDRAAFAAAGLVLADTAAHKAYFCETYGLDVGKVEVLPLGYDDEAFFPRTAAASTEAGRENERFEVLFYGSFLPLHGTEVIVEAAKIVAAKDPSVHFKLVGSGRTQAAVRAGAADSANVEFLGWQPLGDLPGLIAGADVCLGIFGRTEKARRVVPHKIFQCLGMKKALITARTPAVEEFFQHKRNIFLCDEPLAESLAAAVLELKKDRELREAAAGAGFALVREKYSAKAVGRRLLDIIDGHFRPERTMRPK